MLPARHRLGGRREFGEVVRRGARVRRGRLVVHLQLVPPAGRSGPGPANDGGASADASGVKAGFVVSRAVGGSVTRHAVTRRLRAVALPLLAELPDGARLVVRALPEAAGASSAELGSDLSAALVLAQGRSGS